MPVHAVKPESALTIKSSPKMTIATARTPTTVSITFRGRISDIPSPRYAPIVDTYECKGCANRCVPATAPHVMVRERVHTLETVLLHARLERSRGEAKELRSLGCHSTGTIQGLLDEVEFHLFEIQPVLWQHEAARTCVGDTHT